MDRQLLNYLPPVLREVLEFQAISEANEPEISAAWDALDRIMANQFLDTADGAGVSVWERELQIHPKDTDTLEERKQRLKTAWVCGVAYTYNWLADWLKRSCAEDYSSPKLKDYVLHTTLPVSVDYLRILDSMRQYTPANIHIDPLIRLTKIKAPHYTGSALRHSVKQTIQADTWNTDNIYMLSDENGSVLMDGAECNILYEEVSA